MHAEAWCAPVVSPLPDQLQTLLTSQVKAPVQVLPWQQTLPFFPHAHSQPSLAMALQSAKPVAHVM